jgi:glycerol-3-phosphate acyltransferase PlsY
MLLVFKLNKGHMLINILCIIAAYLIGSLSSAIIVCKLWGLPDPRSQGSNNPGATNVLRIGGKVPAIITLLGDGCKGLLPTLLVSYLCLPGWVIGGVMLAALLGHIFPVFFGFRGGKGVATAMGAYLGMSWYVGGILIGIWAAVVMLTRYSSLGAIVASILAPAVGWLMHDVALTVAMCVMSVVLLIRHKDNIVRLIRGKETKI